MLVLFDVVESELLMQAWIGKLNEDLLQPSGTRYEFWSFSVRYSISLAYSKGLISGVKLSVEVPQEAIGIYLCNGIGDSTREVSCFYLGFTGTMGLILLTCSLFLLVYVLHFIVCSSIDTPLYWFDPWPTFHHCLLCIHRFLAKSHVHVPSHAGLGLKSSTYMTVLYTVTYILLFGEFDVGGSCGVGCECGWVFLGSDVVCWMLLLWLETAFSLIFIWK